MRLPLLVGLSLLSSAMAQAPKKDAVHEMGSQPALLTPASIKWMAAPAETGLPSVVQMTVLRGDPFKAGLFSVRLRIPDGGKVAPHWHPTDEHITVLQGTFAAGMGDKLESAALHDFPTGSYILMPKSMHHCAVAKGETIVQ